MKHHYLTTPMPLGLERWGADLVADCGAVIPNARQIAMVDRASDCFIAGKDICRRCEKVRIEADSLRWEYLIAEGQVALDETRVRKPQHDY